MAKNAGLKTTITEEELKRLYYDEGLTMREIGQIKGCTAENIYQYFQKYGLKARNSSDARKATFTRHPELRAKGKNHRFPGERHVKLKCEICGREFRRPLWLAKRYSHHYCSRECLSKRTEEKAANWRGGKLTRICKICGTKFKVRPALVHKGYGRFCSQQCATTDRLRKLAAERPNKSEVALAKVIERNRLPYRYTGDGSVWIGGRNPDFINVNGKKQLIELFGEHWHPIFDVAEKVNLYKEYGFDCLIIWEEELKDEEKLVKKLKKFARKRKVRS